MSNPSDYYFQVGRDDDLGCTYYTVVSKELWDRSGRLDDSGNVPQFLKDAKFTELCEGDYEYEGKGDGRETLLSLGLEEKQLV